MEKKVLENSTENIYIYNLKDSFITEVEQKYLSAINPLIPEDYYIQPQVNLASIITKTDKSRFHNELFRNIDACIFNKSHKPIALIEINDSSHKEPARISRDKKVKLICEEAGIPLIKFWTSYGINDKYMEKEILKAIEFSKNPTRIAHSMNNKDENKDVNSKKGKGKKAGCYIATCVYGSYDCPEVLVLREFRDTKLSSSFSGRVFIKLYYLISPILVKYFGEKTWFRKFWITKLDRIIAKLSNNQS